MKSFILKNECKTQSAKPGKIPHFQKSAFLYHCYLIAFYHDDKLDTFLFKRKELSLHVNCKTAITETLCVTTLLIYC